MDLINEILEKLKTDSQKVLAHFKQELSTIRMGRASPALVENIKVDYYGNPTALKQIASISVPQPNLIVIEPWDKSTIPAVEKAILSDAQGLTPNTEGNLIRVFLPALSEERRQQLVKLLYEKTEAARIQLRQRREEAIRKLQNLKEGKGVSEDDWFRAKDKIQEIIDDHNQQIKNLTQAKEKAILT